MVKVRFNARCGLGIETQAEAVAEVLTSLESCLLDADTIILQASLAAIEAVVAAPADLVAPFVPRITQKAAPLLGSSKVSVPRCCASSLCDG